MIELFRVIQVLLLASLGLSIYMITVTIERCRSEKRYGFMYCCIAMFIFILGNLIEMTSSDLSTAVIGIKILYAGGCFISPLFFIFVADYCEITIPKKFYQIPLLLIAILFYLLVLTFEHNGLLHESYSFNTQNNISQLVISPGPLYSIVAVYPLFCVILSCFVLVRSITRSIKGQRLGLILLLFSALAPLIGNFSFVVMSYYSHSNFGQINYTVFLMVISNFVFFFNVVRNDMFDLAPKAHAVTLDLIRDIFIVLDQNMIYTGSNNKAKELFPELTEQFKGKSILSLDKWPNALSIMENYSHKTLNEEALREIEFTLPHKPGRNYSGWLNRVASKTESTLGWVILIQDITETVKMTNALKYFNDQLRRAFSTYLSEEVVEEIIDDPAKLQLGGINRHLTAMFTDIMNFSTIAEALTPEQLVELLNDYLSAMSNIILEQKGTIDKYQGDAILAFFGAPQRLPDHAIRTCTAAILMKRMEADVNKFLTEKKLCPCPINTRIGINTGEMIVGNMGTQKKMNYTIIGNEVNIAARLEGVNKQYRTSIIVSENTVKETQEKFVFRRLDKIRVVGINEPIRIYELLETKEQASEKILELVYLYNKAMEHFEERRWNDTVDILNIILNIFPEDGPSLLCLDRCRLFLKEEPDKDWDGVFNMMEK